MSTSEQWSGLTDAHGQPYDPRPAFEAIEQGRADEGYAELWERLHHQGDLGTASYRALPELARIVDAAPAADWRPYALAATIEEARHRTNNPPLPQWLLAPYHSALGSLAASGLRHFPDAAEDESVRSILAILAHAKGQRTLAAIALWTEDERQEVLGER